MFRPKMIRSIDDHQNAMKRLDELMDKESLSPEEREDMELIAHLIEEFEKVQFPISLPTPIDAIKFRMDQMGLTQKDLEPYIGNRSKVSRVLNGKQPLSLSMIRALHTGLGIPYESLMSPEKLEYVEEVSGIEWDKFPIKAMYESAKHIFFKDVTASFDDIKHNVEYYIRHIIEPYQDVSFGNTLCRQNVRMGGRSNRYSLAAWISACCYQADNESLPTAFDREKEEIIINQLRVISMLDEGPKRAVEFLRKVGIHVVILPHFPQTHLDGAMLKAKDGNPIIALTLRYDRIDYFWFTLFHELGHVFLHSQSSDDKKKASCYLDDLKVKAGCTEEHEADDFASENLIQDDEMEDAELFDDFNVEKVVTFARQHYIHPAIVAGRIRFKNENYRILSGLVGNGEVRNLFY